MRATVRNLLVAAGLLAPALGLGVSMPWSSEDFTPIEVIRTELMSYPLALQVKNLDEGEVKVMIWVSQRGELLDWMLMGASHPLFAKEVLDTLPKWRFKPATLRGEPISSRMEVDFSFKNTEVIRVIAQDPGIIERARKEAVRKNVTRRIYELGELDQPIDPVVEIPPRPPDQFGAVARQGEVIVDYLVDTEGKVRMPMVIASDDQAFTSSVLLAIAEWRYDVPKRSGLPVISHIRYKFSFSPVHST